MHSEHGARRLTGELGIDPARVTVIPHGAFTHLAALDARLPPELPEPPPGTPVVALPGLLRPYKGIDVLLDAWRRFGADPPGELWIVGMPRMPLPDRRRCRPASASSRASSTTPSWPASCAAPTSSTLPYREIDQSGVLYAALGLGRPLLLSDVGGFPEVAATGAAELVAPGDADRAARRARARCSPTPHRRAALAAAATHAAQTTYAWDAIAQRHLALYGMLTRS